METKGMSKDEIIEVLVENGMGDEDELRSQTKAELAEMAQDIEADDAEDDNDEGTTEPAEGDSTDGEAKSASAKPKGDRKWTDEQKDKLKGLWTPERRAAFSEQMKEKYTNGTLKGRKWTDEEKEAHRQLMKSKYPAKETKPTTDTPTE